MYGGNKGCKTIPEVGVPIRLPESKMAAKMASKIKQTLKIFSMQYAHLSVDIQLYLSPDLYNIVNGQVAPTKVNIQDAFHIGITQNEKCAALLPDAFHGKIERKRKAIFDIDTLFCRLLVVAWR